MTDEQIEYIVREVVRRLRLLGAQVRSTTSPNVDTTLDTLQIDERVVTLETLRGRLEGIHKLVVPSKAVVTPSVRDELRQKKIDLCRG